MAFPASDGAPGWAPPPPPPVRPPSRWVAPVSLIVAVIAVAVAVWALVRPAPQPPAPAGPTAAEIKTATAKACGAYATVSKAVTIQTHVDLGQDPVALAAVAANARLAMAEGAAYLLSHVDSDTPDELDELIRKFADDLHAISMGALAGQVNTDAGQATRLMDAEKTGNKIEAFCGR